MIPKAIIIHHSASSRDYTTLSIIDSWHEARWSNFKSSLGYYVGYQYVIDGRGGVYNTRKENEIAAHTIGWNDKSVGICLTGNFETETPSSLQLEALDSLIKRIMQDWQIPLREIYWHGEKSRTLCCGKNLIEWVKNYRKEKKDMSFFEDILAELTRKVAELRILIQKRHEPI